MFVLRCETYTMNPLATDVVFEPFGLPVTNTMLTGTLVTIVLAIVAVVLRLMLSMWPSRAQVVAEQVIDVWQSLADNAGGKRARRFVPLVGSAFVFILFANWMGALPLKHVRTINPDGNSVELIRSATSDLNLTAAVALMVVVLVELLEMRSHGLKHYVKALVIPNPLRWLEILVRPLSLAFRLFGSVFAGHVLVGTILAIAPAVLFPFLALELFMGLIQAVIFATLSLVFLTIATAGGADDIERTQTA
jgi:F-type H+-transporting ATPase subunit a